MIIDNQRTIIKTKVRKLFFALIACGIVVSFFTTSLKKIDVLGLTNSQAAIAVAVLYFLYYFYHIFIDPYYIYFSDEGEKIIIRFYSARSASSKKMALEIPKSDFHHFEIEKAIINQKDKLSIFQKTGKGVFKYPSICLSALSSVEKKSLLSSLNKYVVKSNN
ncbi:hypothetical protein ACFLTE_02120 [Bacteroidota bacterium]